MTEPTNTSREEEPLRDITLEPGIYDLTPEIRDHIVNEVPFSEETLNVLRTFDEEYDFDRDIKERGKDYNHSAFCDFIISDLVGIRPSMNNSLTINPLLPEGYWDWFRLDRVKYHNKNLTIIWDKDGTRYNKGKGFSIFIDNQLKHNSQNLEKIEIEI